MQAGTATGWLQRTWDHLSRRCVAGAGGGSSGCPPQSGEGRNVSPRPTSDALRTPRVSTATAVWWPLPSGSPIAGNSSSSDQRRTGQPGPQQANGLRRRGDERETTLHTSPGGERVRCWYLRKTVPSDRRPPRGELRRRELVAPVRRGLARPCSIRPSVLRGVRARRLCPGPCQCGSGWRRSFRSSGARGARLIHRHARARIRRDLGGLDEPGPDPSGATCADPSSSDVAVRRTGRQAPRRSSTGLVRLRAGNPSGTAPGVARGPNVVPCLRGRRGDRVHRGMFRRRRARLGQCASRCCAEGPLRGIDPAVPRAHRAVIELSANG